MDPRKVAKPEQEEEMTPQETHTFSKSIVEKLIQTEFDSIPEMYRIILTDAMKAERDQCHQATSKRTEDLKITYCESHPGFTA